MKYRLAIVAACLVLPLVVVFQWNAGPITEQTFSNVTFKYGAKGSDVYELQGRLKFLGYYHGNVDGDYGWRTLQAVKNFQNQFGMKVDGVVGSKTKLKLWEATKKWTPDKTPRKTGATASGKPVNVSSSNSLGLSANDLKIMANAVHGEARGEPYLGQVAVAAVILNRVKDSSFPNTVSGVIFEPGAFTAVADGQIYLSPDKTSQKAVRDALSGWDPTGGCIYYFNPATATSKWIWSRPQVMKIGDHIFCK